MTYRGRFAPSPSGRLHFGSLVSAVASFARARSLDGVWLVRMEDLDKPREVAGAAAQIIQDLAWFGMESDEEVLVQCERDHLYQDALDQLLATGRAYPCGCTRRMLPADGIYPGTCAAGLPPGTSARSFRFRCDDALLKWNDAVQGRQYERARDAAGDFVIRRADGIFAYQLAVVVDDHAQRITEVVRGCDLLSSTARQRALQTALSFAHPDYLHHPVAVDATGAKLGKSTGALPARSKLDAVRMLAMAWKFLGQQEVPSTLRSVTDFWDWAIPRFNIQGLQGPAEKPFFLPP